MCLENLVPAPQLKLRHRHITQYECTIIYMWAQSWRSQGYMFVVLLYHHLSSRCHERYLKGSLEKGHQFSLSIILVH